MGVWGQSRPSTLESVSAPSREMDALTRPQQGPGLIRWQPKLYQHGFSLSQPPGR